MGTVLNKFGLATSGKDISQSVQPLSHTSDVLVASKVNQYYDEICKALNLSQLMPLLSKEQLLDFSEKSIVLADSRSSYDNSRYMLQCLKGKGALAYYKFLCCIKAEKEHMGHRYIASLLEGKPFGSKFELEESSRLKEAIQKHYPVMIQNISLKSLVPLIFSKKLLTEEEEQKLLSNYKTECERVHLLLHLLDTKGPLAHKIFAECLQSESSHPTHKDLHTILISSCHSEPTADSRKRKHTVDDCTHAVALPCRKLLRRSGLQGPLKGETYEKMIRDFQSCILNGDWKRFETEAAKYVKPSVPEYEVVICLERATSWIFRRKPEIALQHVDEAKKIIETKIHGGNHSILLGRSECILSRLFRYLEDYERARDHVIKAKELLYGIEAGEDSARLYYCEACITVECLDKLSTENNFECVDEIFGRAICDDRNCESGLGLFALHSLLRLAQMYLRSTHYTPGTATNHKEIRQANNCLKQIIYSSLSQRSRCLYRLIESDLHRNCKRIDRAKESLELALDIAKRCNFELEICSAQMRLQSLCTSQA